MGERKTLRGVVMAMTTCSTDSPVRRSGVEASCLVQRPHVFHGPREIRKVQEFDAVRPPSIYCLAAPRNTVSNYRPRLRRVHGQRFFGSVRKKVVKRISGGVEKPNDVAYFCTNLGSP